MLLAVKEQDSTNSNYSVITRGKSRTAASSKMELLVIIVNGFQP